MLVGFFGCRSWGRSGFGFGFGWRGGIALSRFFIAFAPVVCDVKSRSLENQPRSSAKQSAHFPLPPFLHRTGSLWAGLKSLVLHGLKNLKVFSAFLTFVFVGWHRFEESIKGTNKTQYRPTRYQEFKVLRRLWQSARNSFWESKGGSFSPHARNL